MDWGDRNFLMFNQDKCKVLHLGWHNSLELLLITGWRLAESGAVLWERWTVQGSVDHSCSNEGKLHVELH